MAISNKQQWTSTVVIIWPVTTFKLVTFVFFEQNKPKQSATVLSLYYWKNEQSLKSHTNKMTSTPSPGGSETLPSSPSLTCAQSAKDKRYDRQLRLWGDHGQTALERARVCVIHATATATEILKSLILPGKPLMTSLAEAWDCTLKPKFILPRYLYKIKRGLSNGFVLSTNGFYLGV